LVLSKVLVGCVSYPSLSFSDEEVFPIEPYQEVLSKDAAPRLVRASKERSIILASLSFLSLRKLLAAISEL